MLMVKGKCLACGKPLEWNIGVALAAAELIAPLCAACTTVQFLDGGGAILELRN
jgi:hypothetical protein